MNGAEGSARAKRGAVFLAAAGAAFVVSVAFALLLFAQNGWFGVGDLRAFFVYSTAFGLLLGGFCTFVTPALWKRSPLVGYVGSALLGLLAAYVFTLGNRRMLEAVFAAWSIPVLQCWLGGGLAGGMAAALSLERARYARALGAGTSLLVLLVALWFAYSPVVIALSRDQRLTIVFLKWAPSEQPLTIEDQRAFEDRSAPALDQEALSLLRSAGVRGHIAVWGRSVHGRGPAATALILLQRPILEQARVRQPDGNMALYVQGPDGLHTFPTGVKTLDREIELSGGPDRVWYSVRLASGGLQGGSAFNW